MSDRNSLRPERTADWATMIAIGTLLAGLIASWVTLREAVESERTATASQAQINRELQERIRSLETSTRLADQLSKISNDVASTQALVSLLRDDVSEIKRRR